MLRRIINNNRRGQRQVVQREFEDEEDDVEEIEEEDDGEGRWTILRHNGPWFESIDRELKEEEMMVLYSRVPESYYGRIFWENFFAQTGLKMNVREARQLLRKTQRDPIERKTTTQKEKHMVCAIKFSDFDAKSFEGNSTAETERISNWKMEPPVIFLGRGDHPMRGCLRRRIVPEDVILNLDPEAPVPKLPRGRRWKEVVHRPECSWLWSWNDPLLGKIKYVYPSAVSKSHSEKERRKFDEARELGNHIDNIRKFYNKSFQTGKYQELASVLYLIDNLGIRIGNENNSAADGATTLRVENIQILDGKRMVRVTFTGKDSIDYDNKVACEPGFVKTIRSLSAGKSPQDFLFPNVTPKVVNTYLQSHHPSLTAKTFRTFNATRKFREAVNKYKPSSTISPIDWFKKCALEVAVFCNHKRAGSTIKRSRLERGGGGGDDKFSPTTSMTNYIDPRVVFEWASKHDVPINKLYSKTLLERFSWAGKEG